MLKNQKQRCKQPAIAYMLSAEKRQSKSRPRKRQIIEELSARKIRVIKTRSDNNHQRKTIEQKKLKSLNLIPKEEIVIEQPFDEYQLNSQDNQSRKPQKDIQPRNKYNQFLRDDSSSSNYGEIVSHYRHSKSRYKYAKQKARKLIQKMITTSKTNSQQISNQLKNKITDIKTQVTNDKFSSNQYCLSPKTPQKTSTVSSSSYFRPKTQKCSTLNFGLRQKTPLGIRLMTSSSTRKNQLSSSKISMALNSPVKINKKPTEEQKNTTTQQSPQKFPSTQKKIPTQKSINTVITSQSGDNNENPLVLKGKHLFTEYGFDQYTKIRTQKEIIEETQNAVKQVSKQISLSRKQTQKLITRARQKNKKIIGKLKEMREKRSSMRNSQSIKNDLSKSNSRFSKIPGQVLRSNLRNSIFQSKLDNLRQSVSGILSNGENILGLNSNVQLGSEVGFNEEIKQKILIHLETIKTIADYAQSFTNIYQDCNEWEDLIFLLYKKYYIQRYKVYQILKSNEIKFHDGSIFKQTPFAFQFCSVSIQELEIFRESKEEISIQLDLQSSNAEIRTALRELYNKFIQKTADNPQMNMYEVDDFSQSILQDLNEEINMLVQSCGKSQKIKKRINEAIQVGLMIAHLEGYTFDQIEEIVVGQLDSREYFEKFYSKFLQIFED